MKPEGMNDNETADEYLARMEKEAKDEKEGNADYIDDLVLTKLLLTEMQEFKDGERKSASNELAGHFLHILDRIMKRANFKGYSDEYKDEFRSKAQILFVKHWYKFKPESIQKNWYTKNKVKHFKEEAEWKGAFTWFSLMSWTGCTDEIKRLNKISEKRKKLIEEENQNLRNYESYNYNQY